MFYQYFIRKFLWELFRNFPRKSTWESSGIFPEDLSEIPSEEATIMGKICEKLSKVLLWEFFVSQVSQGIHPGVAQWIFQELFRAYFQKFLRRFFWKFHRSLYRKFLRETYQKFLWKFSRKFIHELFRTYLWKDIRNFSDSSSKKSSKGTLAILSKCHPWILKVFPGTRG